MDLPVAGGGAAAEALRTQTVQVLPPGGRGREGERWEVLAPVTERGEALGLLQLSLPREPNAAVVEIGRVAHVLSFVVIANRRHTDLFEWATARPVVQPVGGDPAAAASGRRARARPRLHLPGGWSRRPASAGTPSTTAWPATRSTCRSPTRWGTACEAALTASMCVGALRGERRRGGSLLDQAVATNRALSAHAANGDDDDFVTGLLGRLDLPTGALDARQRRARRALPVRDADADRAGAPRRTSRWACSSTPTTRARGSTSSRGDRLVVVTDGMLERGAATLDLIAEIGQTRALHPRETTRRLTDKVLQTCGPTLADDATLLVLDWHGGHGRNRATVAGADPSRASAASRAR